MGQIECCDALTETSQLKQQVKNSKNAMHLKFLNVQDDLSQNSNLHPKYLSSRTNQSNRLGDPQEGMWVENKPRISQNVRQRIASLQPIQLQCFARIEDRGMPSKQPYFQFALSQITYEGEWLNHKPQGYGKNYYPNGGYYEGTFQNGLPNGFGRFINENGDYYQGQVRFGRGDGQGRYETEECSFKGIFKNNVLNGEGEQKGDAHYFKGLYENGTKVRGILKYDENVYEGAFIDDLFEGQAVLQTPEGKYAGGFKDGLQHGYGQFRWNNGSIYRGNYSQGVKHGDGEYYNSANKSISRGLWKKGQLEGNGQYVEPKGTINKVVWNGNSLAGMR